MWLGPIGRMVIAPGVVAVLVWWAARPIGPAALVLGSAVLLGGQRLVIAHSRRQVRRAAQRLRILRDQADEVHQG